MPAIKSTAKTSLAIPQLFSVAGKSVVITGGGRGIGLMISEAFVSNGASVFICSRDEKAIQSSAAALNSIGKGGRCTAITADLSTINGINTFIQTLTNDHHIDHLDILINNSGASWGQPLDQFTEQGWDKVMTLNVKSLFFLTRSLVPLLSIKATIDNPSRVLMIGSVAGIQHQSVPTYSYDVSKAAVHHLTRKLADDLSSLHITVNCLAPGYIPTKMSAGLPTSVEQMGQAIPLKRAGSSEDMGGCALYLCSRAGSWVTGVTIPVDGGLLTMAKL